MDCLFRYRHGRYYRDRHGDSDGRPVTVTVAARPGACRVQDHWAKSVRVDAMTLWLRAYSVVL